MNATNLGKLRNLAAAQMKESAKLWPTTSPMTQPRQSRMPISW